MQDSKPQTENTAALMSRLQAVLAHTDLDCDCKETVRTAIDRFASLEQRRLMRRCMATARDHKERIIAILSLLQELNQVSEIEPDRSVFSEMALLFEDIASLAKSAAHNVRAVTSADWP
jgi:hypothetical protein